jgi:hypothetical protein
MKGLSKEMIDAAFLEGLAVASFSKGLPPAHITLAVRIFEKGKILLQLCRRNVPLDEVKVSNLLGLRMVGLRFTPNHVENLFRTIHNAFMMETGLKNPARISLLFYNSKLAGGPCIGVLQDEKPYKCLMVSEIIQAIELESEQLN